MVLYILHFNLNFTVNFKDTKRSQMKLLLSLLNMFEYVIVLLGFFVSNTNLTFLYKIDIEGFKK